MTITNLSSEAFTVYAPKLFAILSENMRRLHPGELVTEADYRAWLDYQTTRLAEKRFVALETDGALAGYLQFSVSGGVLTVEELEIAPGWQNGAALRSLLRALPALLPDGVQTVAAYIHKENRRSRRLAEHFGLRPAGETESGQSLLYAAPRSELRQQVARGRLRAVPTNESDLGDTP